MIKKIVILLNQFMRNALKLNIFGLTFIDKVFS
jgi:hypothetical protein